MTEYAVNEIFIKYVMILVNLSKFQNVIDLEREILQNININCICI